MNIKMLPLSLFGFIVFSLTLACTSSKEENTDEQEPEGPKIEEYVGTYKIQETINDRYCDVSLENDTLYLFSRDIGKSVMYAEENEVFDVPGHKTRMRFMRDNSKEIDRIIILTKKGRFTAIKVKSDSLPPTK